MSQKCDALMINFRGGFGHTVKSKDIRLQLKRGGASEFKQR